MASFVKTARKNQQETQIRSRRPVIYDYAVVDDGVVVAYFKRLPRSGYILTDPDMNEVSNPDNTIRKSLHFARNRMAFADVYNKAKIDLSSSKEDALRHQKNALNERIKYRAKMRAHDLFVSLKKMIAKPTREDRKNAADLIKSIENDRD